ncbi:hypothetical protein ACPCSP_31270 [Streptomyces cinereoruber]|uniref:hypothetical protein n=1 Tax=Streptomyces cinereoruber TaxID=67260 RepID=UPI003C2CF539
MTVEVCEEPGPPGRGQLLTSRLASAGATGGRSCRALWEHQEGTLARRQWRERHAFDPGEPHSALVDERGVHVLDLTPTGGDGPLGRSPHATGFPRRRPSPGRLLRA